jgi:predicted RNA binding protein YcfA (HicA-like mRNA interferase family)
MRATELLRRLRRRASRLALVHEETPGKGSHLKVLHGSRQTVIPMHSGDMPKGTYRAILRQLGLRETDLED